MIITHSNQFKLYLMNNLLNNSKSYGKKVDKLIELKEYIFVLMLKIQENMQKE